MLLPENFNFTGKSRDGNKIVIKKGLLLEGIMDKNSLGEESGLLLRELHKKYGQDITVRILEKMFRLGIQVLLRTGFTTTISDTDLPQEAKQKIKEVMDKADEDVKNADANTDGAADCQIKP